MATSSFGGRIMFLLLLIGVSGLIPKPAMAADRVKYLPGFQGPLPFELETGYIGVGQSEEVQLFYYFIKSESIPEIDPVFIWLVGGPGCSAIYAIANDVGPLRFDGREYNGSLPTLSYNPYGLTQVANVIFIDQPVGTGFSYSKTETGKESDNLLAAEHVYQFLRKWFVFNPNYQSNPFYIGGDSYGGTFAPVIMQTVSDGNEAGIRPRINLKGYVLGNPVTFLPGEKNYLITFAHGMALISDELYKSLERHCGGEYQNIDPRNILCQQYDHTFKQLLTGLYEDHILEPICDLTSTEVHKYSSQRRSLDEKFDKLESTWPIGLPGMKCRENWNGLSNFWANDNATREALHVRKGTVGEWRFCNGGYILFTFNVNNTIPYHAYLSARGYRSLIYSGDHDGAVTFQSTQAWIRSLNYSIIDDWRPWISDGQIAGYTRTYSNRMTYATVKGAGHIAPNTKPFECFTMIKRWLSLEPL